MGWEVQAPPSGSLSFPARALEARKATYGDLLGGLGLPELKANEDRRFAIFWLNGFSGFAILAQALCLGQVANPAVVLLLGVL